jgi:hypothetical protein
MEKPRTKAEILALPVMPEDQFVFRWIGGEDTIFDVKDDAGLMWKVYQGRDGNWYRGAGLVGFYPLD